MPVKKVWSLGRLVVSSILLTIVLGAFLLNLTISQQNYIPFIDCLFTAASSVCVTGLLTIPLESFTAFGKVVILILMQIGGVGLITLSLVLISLFTELGLATKLMAGQILELETSRHIKQVLIFIGIFTLSLEIIGAIFVYFIINQNFGFGEAVFNSIFHAVSSFCSVGLSFSGNSLIDYRTNLPMLLITGLLIFFGTTGFMTWYEIVNYLKRRIQGRRKYLSLTTKIVIYASIIMTIITTIFLLLLEPNIFSDLSWPLRVANMLFNSIAFRSTVLSTINLSEIQAATILFILTYGLIAAAPSSTGGGIKITTFVIFLATIRSVLIGRPDTEIKNRRIPQDQVFKALSILSLSFCWIIISTFLLLLLESDKPFMAIFFGTISSFTTLGLETGITPYLSVAGKILIIINMLIGRLGSLTFLLAFIRSKRERTEFQYPEERIML